MRKFWAIALFAGLMLAGCLPVTTSKPLGSTQGAGLKPDRSLIGAWRVIPAGTDKQAGFLHIIDTGGGGLTAVMIDEGKPKDDGSDDDEGAGGGYSVYYLTTTTLGGHHYMNVQSVFDNGRPADGRESKSFVPVRYSMGEDGTLTLSLIDEDKAKAAIKSGAVAGTVTKDRDADAEITAPPKDLDAFFASDQGAALFAETLARLKRVPPQP